MWFTKKPEPRTSFPVGGYTLDMMLREAPPLCELSPEEYAAMGRRFVGERIYHAPEVTFVGREWSLTLGAVRGRLYKIAPYVELRG